MSSIHLKINLFKAFPTPWNYLPSSFPQVREWMEKERHPTPVSLPGKSHGQRSLVSCNPWGRKESDTTERLHFHFSLSCIGEGNGNPLQCSCLENPRDGGAWWAAVYGVAHSQTRLKRLSSSSSDGQEHFNRKSLKPNSRIEWKTEWGRSKISSTSCSFMLTEKSKRAVLCRKSTTTSRFINDSQTGSWVLWN